MKKFTKMLVLALAMVFMVGAGDVAEAKGKVTKVQITKVGKTNVKKKTKLTIKRDGEDKKVQLTAKATVKGGASKTLVYSSSNKKVVSVSKTGMMTIKKAGKATITVKSKQNKKKLDKITITVKQNVTSVKLTSVKGKKIAKLGNVISVQKGKKITLKAAVAPKTASNKKVSFTSKNKKVATVTSKGVVKGKKNGTCYIKYTLKTGKVLKCKITVVNPVTCSTAYVSDTSIYNECGIKFTNYTNKKITYIELNIKQYDNKGSRVRSPYDWYYVNDTLPKFF